ncbi:hypothetical protein SteCoe_1382 [Stentor coeruleus]|uniref:Uncharacterized protein n=1 Tax=Stentor coeruleus TaxID=5963 RepID=A0A1R2D265_9CILI|nr:hypothetical protein SteCoe_1382 [Stentor coeruleus]
MKHHRAANTLKNIQNKANKSKALGKTNFGSSVSPSQIGKNYSKKTVSSNETSGRSSVATFYSADSGSYSSSNGLSKTQTVINSQNGYSPSDHSQKVSDRIDKNFKNYTRTNQESGKTRQCNAPVKVGNMNVNRKIERSNTLHSNLVNKSIATSYGSIAEESESYGNPSKEYQKEKNDAPYESLPITSQNPFNVNHFSRFNKATKEGGYYTRNYKEEKSFLSSNLNSPKLSITSNASINSNTIELKAETIRNLSKTLKDLNQRLIKSEELAYKAIEENSLLFTSIKGLEIKIEEHRIQRNTSNSMCCSGQCSIF